ncbi:MAG: metabolite traffic protein EboE [Verrucomicrobia bacterium]|nr:metabolite traffic protein EboE [Verrucomicrobiota bacterium]
MKLSHGLHLAYCTNIHRGESWTQTFETLQKYTLAVRDKVCVGKPYAIGLRLGADAARELSDRYNLLAFQKWLERNNCYVFTINGFPYGKFHGTRVKEQVYAPDWTTPERLDYTNLLFDLLAQIVPAGIDGSVSTVPVSFKGFKLDERGARAARTNLWRCVDHLEQLTRRTGRNLHLGLEPEPCCFLETTGEAVAFFDQLRADRPGDMRLDEHLGINYDCCHLAVEFESPTEALQRLRRAGIKISKIHLSNALKVRPTLDVRAALKSFADDIYFHQTIERRPSGEIFRYGDLDEALTTSVTEFPQAELEWRIHFHIPLHARPTALFDTTADHLVGVLDEVKRTPSICSHFEMETYTWEVMPPELKKRNVVDQLVSEYEWTLAHLAQRGFKPE